MQVMRHGVIRGCLLESKIATGGLGNFAFALGPVIERLKINLLAFPRILLHLSSLFPLLRSVCLSRLLSYLLAGW